ncbi:hypothetical protein HF329_23670 [Chitinophaga oryzae]|uniref:Uncharacterized protein n=1 Tax=Chitinophaga oryzae TaxID=2725414 RepID=A0AAE6ZJF4_9BACT|nr:hypothetical protein [Chitinophaga oryzae]QJB34121.1 hypothetical protein HF329_23670 [Chitinophaga oryzae]
MDKLFSDELQYYIDTARLKTARQKRRAVITARDKQLLQLDEYEKELWSQSRKPIYVPLDPPVQKGYVRFFVLRDDVARGKQALFFQGILDKINTEQYFHRKDFKKKKRVRGKKVWVDKEQHVKKLYAWEVEKLGLTPQEMAYFEVRPEFSKLKGKEVLMTVFTEPWRFVLRVRPYMLTHRRVVDPVLESRMREVDNYITIRQLRHRMNWLTQSRGGGRRRWEPPVKAKERYKKKTLLQMLQEEYYDNID